MLSSALKGGSNMFHKINIINTFYEYFRNIGWSFALLKSACVIIIFIKYLWVIFKIKKKC